MENAQIADLFDEIADLLELKEGNQYRIRSYRNAARTVRDLSRRLEDMVEEGEKLADLPNIGESIAGKIGEIIETGKLKQLDKLHEQIPEQLTRLMKIPQLGPRKAMQLHRELDINNVAELKKACEEHRVRELEGMGEKTEEKILEGIATVESTSGRVLYSAAADHVESLGRRLDKIRSIRRWEVAGSFRRAKETVGDLDVLIESDDRKKTTEEVLDYEDIDEVIARGKEKVSIRLGSGLRIDLRYFEKDSFGAAFLYFTGSKAHNIALRKRVQDRGWKLNEYGLFKNNRTLAGKTEESVYHRLNLAWIPPELREDRGEIQAAEHDGLPALIETGNLRGDMHCHTNRTDGANTLEEMADAATERGYDYLAITDHSKAVTVAQGLDEKEIRNHAEEIRKLDDNKKGVKLLAGVEVDILKRGKLDLDEQVLADLDWVVASVHSYFNLSEKETTERLITAVKTGVIHCIGHITGRMVGKREPMAFDVEKVINACVEHDVAIEINSQPDRLDPPDSFCQQARDVGVQFVIGSDAHKTSDFRFVDYGVNIARRGWLERKHVLNTRTVRQLKKRIKRD